MIRVGDMVETHNGVGRVEAVGDGVLRVIHKGSHRPKWDTYVDADALLLCGRAGCTGVAAGFSSGAVPLCETCSQSLETPVFDVRPDVPPAIVACVCGESLDHVTPDGVWTLAEIACEYRTCLHCRSTRAYMPADKIPGIDVQLAEEEGCGGRWASLIDALEDAAPMPRSELVRNGVVLATVFVDPFGTTGWRIAAPTRET